MKQLEKFNQLFSKIIFQAAENDFNTNINYYNNYDAFFRAYIQPLAQKLDLKAAVKVRYNVFRLYGTVDQLVQFFTKFKVDKQFIQNSEQFKICNPMITLGDVGHFYNNKTIGMQNLESQGNDLITAGTTETLKELNDNNQYIIQGRWFNLMECPEETDPEIPESHISKQILCCTPAQLAKKIKKCNIADEKRFVVIQFTVNCDRLPNNSFQQLARFVPVTYSQNGKYKDVADTINNRQPFVNKYTSVPIVKDNESLVGDTKKIIKKTKVTDYNKKNKNKTTKK